ncbi:hypothetical protein KW882_04510 [Vibrio parahaemolyticus]
MNKSEILATQEHKLKSIVTQSAMTTIFSPILIALLCLGLNFFSGSGSLDFSTFYFVAIALVVSSLSDMSDAYSRITGSHALDIVPAARALKRFKHNTLLPSFGLTKQFSMVVLTITVLGDLASGYLTESVIVTSVPSVTYNEFALLISSVVAITVCSLSIIGKPTNYDVTKSNKKLEAVLILSFMMFGALSIHNSHTNFATVTFSSDSEMKEVRVSYLVTSDLLPSELITPTIYGSEKLAIKLLSSLDGNDFSQNASLSSVIANALLSNATINLAEELISPPPSHLLSKKGYQERDIESLKYFLSGNYEAYVNSCLEIIKESKGSRSRGSYAVSLMLHLVDGGLLKVEGIDTKFIPEPISSERKRDIAELISLHDFLSSPSTKILVN